MNRIQLKVAIRAATAALPVAGREYIRGRFDATLALREAAEDFGDDKTIATIDAWFKNQFSIWHGRTNFPLPDYLERKSGESIETWIDRCYQESGYKSSADLCESGPEQCQNKEKRD